MKTFTTSGTGNQQTLSPIETDKIPVYDSVTDAEADLANLAENQIIATHDTGSELSAPVDTVQSGNMHAVTSNAVAQAIGYSTTEVETGILFNNKKVYKRTCYIGNFPSNIGINSFDIGLTNIDVILKFNTTMKRANGDMIELPYMDSSNYYVIYHLTSNGILNIITSVDETGAKVVVNLEYTKTTV